MGPAMKLRAVLVIVLSCGVGFDVHASRQILSIGEYVRQADLIVVGDTRPMGAPDYGRTIAVREVLKGDRTLQGTEMVLKQGERSTADAHLPAPASGVAVLLVKGWRDAGKWPVVEAYSKPEDVAALRTIIGIYDLPSEKDRFLALRSRATAGDSYSVKQFVTDIQVMREPENLLIATEAYDTLDPQGRLLLVQTLGRTADPRVVPTLIKAMSSPGKEPAGWAATILESTFPGSPGVTESFERALGSEAVGGTAVRYLLKRRDTPDLRAAAEPMTSWRRAYRLNEEGKRQEAKAIYLGIVEDPKENDYRVCWSAQEVLKDATQDETDRVRAAVVRRLSAETKADRFAFNESAVQVLRALHHPDCLDLLMAIVVQTDYFYDRSGFIAALAIRELGPEARRKGMERLLTGKVEPVKSPLMRVEDASYLLRFLWLMESTADERPKTQSAWPALGRLTGLPGAKDEGAFLISILPDAPKLPYHARRLVVWRLGDLKDRRAVAALADAVALGWKGSIMTEAGEALSAIGGPEAEDRMLALVTHPDRDGVRTAAVDVLFKLQGKRAADLARRMLREDDLGVKSRAMSHLGRYGTPDDIALLKPYADFWKSDRATLYWAVSAISNIRDRFNYDVNGPIVKTTSPAGAP